MLTQEIIKEINQLPISKRFLVIEKTLKSIRQSELKDKMEKAADKLLLFYKSDEELTAFSKLDFENFYETR